MPEKLNFPGAVAHYFIESKLTVLMMLAMLCFGIIGLLLTPREENPQIIVSGAEITVTLAGALPLEVEHLLLLPLQADLASINGVKHVYGTAFEGLASVVLEFEVGEDKDNAMVRIYHHVLRNKHRLPPGAGEPAIQAIDIDDVPVFTVTLSSQYYTNHDLRRMAQRMLERLRGVKGSGIGYVTGGMPREIRIETQPEHLQAYGVSVDQLATAIRHSDINKSLGMRVYQQENRSLRVQASLKNAEQISRIVVYSDGRQVVRVSDLATVIDGPPRETTQMTRFAFGPADPRAAASNEPEMAAATLAIAKRTGFNAVDLTAELAKRVKQMQAGFLPPDVNVVITRDDGVKADLTVTILVAKLFIAIVAVAIVLLIFLGRRAALIVCITIPLVFSVVIGMAWIADLTLNRITLYALILALGVLVDDAIVVVENIHRHFDQMPADASKSSRVKAAVVATAEIGNPTTLATFTVVTVFLSLHLVSGMLGDYFYPVAFSLPVAMIASMVIAYSVTPWLARRWMLTAIGHAGSPGMEEMLGAPSSDPHEGEHLRGEEPRGMQDFYRKLITPLLQQGKLRRLFYLAVALLLVLSFLQPAWQFVRSQGVTGQWH